MLPRSLIFTALTFIFPSVVSGGSLCILSEKTDVSGNKYSTSYRLSIDKRPGSVRNISGYSCTVSMGETTEEHHKYLIGDVVRVVDGPFADFNGIVRTIYPERKRILVDILILGRATPVDLELTQIIPLNKCSQAIGSLLIRENQAVLKVTDGSAGSKTTVFKFKDNPETPDMDLNIGYESNAIISNNYTSSAEIFACQTIASAGLSDCINLNKEFNRALEAAKPGERTDVAKSHAIAARAFCATSQYVAGVERWKKAILILNE